MMASLSSSRANTTPPHRSYSMSTPISPPSVAYASALARVSSYTGPGSGSSNEWAEKSVTRPTLAPEASSPTPRRSITVTVLPARVR
jgi:hypothetical protein